MKRSVHSPTHRFLSSAAAWLVVTCVAPADAGPGAISGAAAGAVAGQTDETAGIVWHDDLLEAHLDADQAGRPVALYVRSAMCESCDKMLEQTLVDERVVEAAGAFTWVLYDKEKHKEELVPFNVFAFPSVLVLGPKNENVYRFDGFRQPLVFLADMNEALRRYELFEEKKDWDARPPRPTSLFPGKTVDTMGLPINEAGHGVAFVEGKLFVVQQRNLFGFDAETLEWKTSFPLPSSDIRDICTDGTLIYALPWGWTKGDPITAIDPATGSTVTTIVTERNKKQRHSSAQGIEWFKGELYVLAERGRIYVIDPGTGEIRISMTIDLPTYGLAWDGEHLVTVNQRGVHFVSPSGKLIRSVASNYPLGSVGYNDGTYYLFESEIRGYDREHRFVKIWPETTLLYKVAFD